MAPGLDISLQLFVVGGFVVLLQDELRHIRSAGGGGIHGDCFLLGFQGFSSLRL